jgi:hypothetical protein
MSSGPYRDDFGREITVEEWLDLRYGSQWDYEEDESNDSDEETD